MKHQGFDIIQEKLQAEGWYVGWSLPCCQTCAWGCVPFEHKTGPFKGQEVDFDKVLFNHEQDLEEEPVMYCPVCESEGSVPVEDEKDEFATVECTNCNGTGLDPDGPIDIETEEYKPDFDWDTFPEEVVDNSSFCFSSNEKGVKNLKAIVPMLEEIGCRIDWNETGDDRPRIDFGKVTGEQQLVKST